MSLPKTFTMKVAGGKTVEVPSVGYGTWASGERGWCKTAVLDALKAGYRHLDCAWMYGVDGEIGEAIKESGIPREEIFVTSKFWPNFGAPENVEVCLDIILKNMGLDYIDLYLAHWPYTAKPISKEALLTAKPGPGTSPTDRAILTHEGTTRPVMDWQYCASNIAKANGQEGSYNPTYTAMAALVKAGKTRAIGLSNFSITEIEEVLPHAASLGVPISCLQVEVHPWLPQNELLAFCKANGILMSCYSPFAGQKKDGENLIKDKTVIDLAEKNGLGVGGLLQSWAVQRGTIPLGKSSKPERIAGNLAVKKLSDEDFEKLNGLALPGNEGRTIDFSESLGIKLFSG